MITASRRKTSSRSSRQRSAHPFVFSPRSNAPSQHSSGNEKAEKDAEKDTDAKLKEIKQIGDKSGKNVIDQLLRAVSDVQPVAPDRVEQPVA